MNLPAEDATPVLHRLRRAEGQLRAVIRSIDEGSQCDDVVVQLAAVSRALDRAGFAVVASGLRQCLIASQGGDADATASQQRLEKLFLSLA